eukprot:TRINITY_DN3345_c0_g1_i1.p1 TRINITY_DN3345_c0_g1~~TRINITY_DN3345_c0_g1_i1.p1  ORF type:complete len:403 (-),score=214.46 TRINITY_DN3345_c0_g1_i1:126-1334(-)
MGYYITKQGEENLLKYQYSGADTSYYYRFVLTPLNKWAINFFPMWMAPNVITIAGMLFSVSANALVGYYCPTFTEAPPSWVYVYVALSLWCYQTLDNLDGRQARRTGASSPLGLLFDHGVDALQCTMGTMTMACVLQVGTGWKLMYLWSVAFVPFVFATWEEYWTGTLILGRINGPSDGILISMILCFCGAVNPGFFAQPFSSSPFWTAILQWTPIPLEWEIHWFAIMFTAVALVPTVGANLHAVHTKNTYRPTWNLAQCLVKTFPFALHFFLAWTWFLESPTNVFASYPRVFLFGIGFLFGNLVCKLMLAHLTHMGYVVLRRSQLPLLIAVAQSVWLPRVLPDIFPIVPEHIALMATTGFAVFLWAHFVTSVIAQITKLLDINCFSLTEKQLAAIEARKQN